MTAYAVLAATGLTALAVLHSALGEAAVLQPLFADPGWKTPHPRWAMERLLRFAWHLTSVSWLALAAVALGAPVGLVVAGFGLLSALVVLGALWRHLAWPVFLAVGLAGLGMHGWLGPAASERALAGGIALAAVIAAAVLFWSSRPATSVHRPGLTTS